MVSLRSCVVFGSALWMLAGCRFEAQLPAASESEHSGAAGGGAPAAAVRSSTRKSGAGTTPELQPRANEVPSGSAAGRQEDEAPDDEVSSAEGGEIPNALLGSWYASSGGTSIPFDPSTGKFGMQNGSGLLYEFAADATYSKAFQSYASNAGCTTGFTAQESGTMQVAGNTLKLVPDAGEIHYRDNCAPSLDSDRVQDDLSTEQFNWQLTGDGLRLTRSDGATSVFVRTSE